ncbi:MAG: hypothetical protein SGPRY_013594 [Prymnesium sp.]
MPMDTMSTQMQLRSFCSPIEVTRAIVQANGVRGLYAGFWPFCLQSSAKTSVRFFSYESLCAAVDRCGVDRSANPGFWSLACGMGSGVIESLGLTAPTDRVKVMKQAASTERGGKPVTGLALVREHGILTLYRGALATTLRQSSSVAVRFFCFSKIKTWFCSTLGYDERHAPAWVLFLAGGTGGMVSVALNNPIDIAKSKIQAGIHTSIVESIQETDIKKKKCMRTTRGVERGPARQALDVDEDTAEV